MQSILKNQIFLYILTLFYKYTKKGLLQEWFKNFHRFFKRSTCVSPSYFPIAILSLLLYMIPHMQIFFSGSQSTADMALGLVQIQDLPRLRRQSRIYLKKSFCAVFMFGRYNLELFYFHIRLPLKCFHLIPNHLVNEGKYPHFHLCLLLFS